MLSGMWFTCFSSRSTARTTGSGFRPRRQGSCCENPAGAACRAHVVATTGTTVGLEAWNRSVWNGKEREGTSVVVRKDEVRDAIARRLSVVFEDIRRKHNDTKNLVLKGRPCSNAAEIRQCLISLMQTLEALPGIAPLTSLNPESLRKMVESGAGLTLDRVIAFLRVSPYWNAVDFDPVIAPVLQLMDREDVVESLRSHFDGTPPPARPETARVARRLDATIEELRRLSAHEKVLVLTANDNETRALAACFFPQGEPPALDGRQVYRDLGRHGRFRVISVVASRLGGGAAQSTVQQAIDELGVGTVLAIGIAFGIDRSKYNLGDVLISESVQYYELGKLTPGGSFVPRGANDSVHHNLLQKFRDRHQHGKPSAYPHTWPQTRFGLMLSGDKLIEHRDYREHLRKHWPNAIGGELVSAGMVEAIQAAQTRPQWIVVKGISDWADGLPIDDLDVDTRQLMAAWNASLMAKAVLDPASFTESSPLPDWMMLGGRSATRSFKPLQIFHDTFLEGRTHGPELVVVPEGEFLMGATPADPVKRAEESPAVRISFSQPFALGRHPVTFDEFDLFCEDTGRLPPADNGWGRGKLPVINVNWSDALSYVEWLTMRTGYSYSLPSEAAWEYACRAGSESPFSGGRTFLTERDANFHVEGRAGSRTLRSRGRTSPVATFPANAWGFFDMHGNVAEWTADLWHESAVGRPTDGSVWFENATDSRSRVQRGGSWDEPLERLRSAARVGEGETARRNTYGFRVRREL